MTYHEHIVAIVEGKSVSKINGIPTLEHVKTLQDELAKIAAYVKTSLLKEGNKYGYLAIMTSKQEYHDLIDNQMWTKDEPQDPGLYDSLINGRTTDIKKAQLESAFKIKKKDYNIALDADWIRYSGITPLQMVVHLRDNMCKVSNHDKIN